MSQGKIKTLIAIFGVLIGGIGIYINFAEGRDERPNLILEIEELKLTSAALERNFLDDLTRIEELYGAVTADKVHFLMDEIKIIDFSRSDNQDQLKEFSTHLQSTIKFFNSEFKNWTADEIQYKDGIIIWPDGVDYDLLNDARVEMNFPNLIDRVRANPGGLDSKTIRQIKREAFNLYKPPSPETFEDRKNVGSMLRGIRESIQKLINKENLKILVKLNVMNRSPLPNFIKSKAILRFHQGDSIIKDLDISVTSNSIIPGHGLNSLIFESPEISSFDTTTRKILNGNFQKKYNYSLFIEDANDIIWFTSDAYSSSSSVKKEKDFIDRVNEVFSRLIE